jgi:hypothetical protein
MRKLKLELGELVVTSFEVPATGVVRGTVAGHKTAPETMPQPTCGTCPASCGGVCLTVYEGEDTCSPSCAGSCGSCAPSCDQLYSCDNMATCLQYQTCGYVSCVPEQCA